MDKVLGVWLDADLIRNFKVFCVKHEISMESVVREAIEERLKNESPEKSPKRVK